MNELTAQTVEILIWVVSGLALAFALPAMNELLLEFVSWVWKVFH